MTSPTSPHEEGVTLSYLLSALGSTVVQLRAAPAGTDVGVSSVALLDTDDLAAGEPGAVPADFCVLAGVPADQAIGWLQRSTSGEHASGPVAVVIKDVSDELCAVADRAGIAIGVLHAQARAELVLSTVRSLLDGAAARQLPEAGSGEPFVEESDLYGLAQRVAALTGGLVSIEDERSRLLAYSATDGAADELRMLSILGREGPAEHLRRLRELGVFERLRRSPGVVEVPSDERLGWRRRLVVSIQPLGADAAGTGDPLGTIWIQEGYRALDPDSASVLEGAAAIAARLIHRVRSGPTQETIQVQRLLGIRGGGVDVPSLASALALPTTGPAIVVGIAPAAAGPSGQQPAASRERPTGTSRQPARPVPTADISAALRLLAGAYARESLVTSTSERMYVLLPRVRRGGIGRWVGTVLDRLTARFGVELRAAVAAPVTDLSEVPSARAEVDRVLDRPAGVERVTTLTESRTPVLLGEIADLVGARAELQDPRLAELIGYDSERDASLVETLERYLLRFGDVRAAAADLHVHPNTLRYRVRRAEQILGMSLDDADARLLLQIQLLARRRSG